jgi:hypothetical protein
MKVSKQTEVRTTNAIIVQDAPHFWYDGTAYFKGTGSGNHDTGTPVAGAMRGTVKVVSLGTSGWSDGIVTYGDKSKGTFGTIDYRRFSLRSIGPDGDGTLLHVSANTKVLVNFEESTVAEFFAKYSK